MFKFPILLTCSAVDKFVVGTKELCSATTTRIDATNCCRVSSTHLQADLWLTAMHSLLSFTYAHCKGNMLRVVIKPVASSLVSHMFTAKTTCLYWLQSNTTPQLWHEYKRSLLTEILTHYNPSSLAYVYNKDNMLTVTFLTHYNLSSLACAHFKDSLFTVTLFNPLQSL